jgi:lipopolysaccharide export system permease protein
LVPGLIGFGVVTGMFQVELLVDYLDLWIRRGIPLWAIAQIFLYSLGYMAALSIPCGVLVASLVTFGRMSQDLEIVAVKSSGINLFQVVIGPLVMAVLLSIGLAFFNAAVLPESNHAYANLLADIGRKRPTIRLKQGVFNDDFPGYRVLVDSLDARTNDMRGVSLLEFAEGPSPTLIVAREGHLAYTADGNTAVLTLREGEIHMEPTDAPDPNTYRVMRFDTHVINVAGAGEILEREVRATRSEREMSSSQLEKERDIARDMLVSARERLKERLVFHNLPPATMAWVLNSASPETWWAAVQGAVHPGSSFEDKIPPAARADLYLSRLEVDTYRKRIALLEVELHKKYSLAFACVVFVLVGAPLGVRVRRGGLTVGFLSLIFFLFYYMCLVVGEGMAERLLLSPLLAMWLPDILLGAVGLVWTLKTCDVRWPWWQRAAPPARPPVLAALSPAK